EKLNFPLQTREWGQPILPIVVTSQEYAFHCNIGAIVWGCLREALIKSTRAICEDFRVTMKAKIPGFYLCIARF
ncbi:MAG: hypothetical protein ACSW8F_06195, partial [bacterium]